MDALDVFYRVRHKWPEYEALMAKLRWVFASGSHLEALAVVHSQRSYVMNHHGHRPPGRDETGGMIGSVTTREEALELCARHQPELLVTSDQLEDGDGLELVREAHQRWPELPILLVMKTLSLPRLRLALGSGSRGVLTDALFMRGYVLAALRAVLAGERYLDPALRELLEENAMGWDPQLSEKQLQILQEVVYGLSDRQIAEKLSIPYDTVRYCLKQAYRELGTSNRMHAALLLVQQGLLKTGVLPAQGLSREFRL
jgi:NarL family two-component system response regulator LiaR